MPASPVPRGESAAARLLASLASLPGKEAIVFGKRSLSFGDISLLAGRYARSLAALGVRRGDRVAVFAETTPDLVVALVGHHLLGAVHVPVNTHYREEEAGHILRDSGATAILLDPASPCAQVLRRCGELPSLRHVISLGAEGTGIPFASLVPFATLAAFSSLVSPGSRDPGLSLIHI